MRYGIMLVLICGMVFSKGDQKLLCTYDDDSRIHLDRYPVLLGRYSVFEDILFCALPPSGMPGVAIDPTKCYCQSKTSDQEYCLPFIQNPTDLSYPCSPTMLEIYAEEKQKYIKQKETQCKQFKKDWNADKYLCIFDTDSERVRKCHDRLYEKYCR